MLNEFIASVQVTYPGQDNYSRPQLVAVKEKYFNNKGFAAFINNPKFKVSHGVYYIPNQLRSNNAVEAPVIQDRVSTKPDLVLPFRLEQPEVESESLVPKKNKQFVPFGDYNVIKNIIRSERFCPVYITGESGNGKTEFCYQACAEENRELIRANITSSTDEEDLIGGFRLINGETVWQNGPATEAMLRGAILLLDEVNLGTEKIMCLQPVLEGKAIYIKKINKYIEPKNGFNIIATANTKGKGSFDGRYIGSQILNEAFLDRFSICIEHKYPSKGVEFKILLNLLKKENKNDSDHLEFAKKLCEWSDIIRKTFEIDGIDELITTRRLRHIVEFYMFGMKNRKKAIEYSINRFDEETKRSMVSLYQKVDDSVSIEEEEIDSRGELEELPEEVPF